MRPICPLYLKSLRTYFEKSPRPLLLVASPPPPRVTLSSRRPFCSTKTSSWGTSWRTRWTWTGPAQPQWSAAPCWRYFTQNSFPLQRFLLCVVQLSSTRRAIGSYCRPPFRSGLLTYCIWEDQDKPHKKRPISQVASVLCSTVMVKHFAVI